jgi:hypothetical protein
VLLTVIAAVVLLAREPERGGPDAAPPTVIKQSSTLPEGVEIAELPVGALASTPQEVAAAWSRFQIAGEPPSAVTAGTRVLFIGVVEASSCPLSVARVERASRDEGREGSLEVELSIPPDVRDCTADANPLTLVLEVAQDVEGPVFIVSDDSVDQMSLLETP